MDPQIVDRIYECSFMPDLWPNLLGELAEIAAARAGFLFISNGHIHDWATSTEIATEALKPLVENGWIVQSERFKRLLGVRHSGFVVDHDIYTDEEMITDPFYTNLLYPRGLGWGAAMAVPLPTGDCFSINLERERVRGPVEKSAIQVLDELRPHLARSALLSARLQLERARVASDTLAAIGLPALLLSESGQVLAANHLIEPMTGYIRWLAGDRVALKDRGADKLLRDAIVVGKNGARSFPARNAETEEVMVAHIIPIRLSARDIFTRCVAALVLTPVISPLGPPIDLVRSLFDLTPAEARVARGLSAGGTVEAIATASGVSLNTIRTQVRGVLTKTGCSRQADVVALLAGIWSPQPRHQV